ncbi:hypothetical protein F4821DRAFT_177894 [Hypoxylon rubiginosum]|uniref:Uncharacterized protein n=1 Tax=Hypoxylon rubiginosum TaxID=110542 RepID=A0ACC0CUK7_9PEZI|nr:hypothetical protein F4821DRAFT_177894 [Hypoxylon rubiginosum]
MRASLSIAAALVGAAAAAPKIPFASTTDTIPGAPLVYTRQSTSACFLIGDETLPAETADIAADLASSVTCSSSVTTIANVPDVISGSTAFSSIDFSQSSQTPLTFALSKFATASPLADTDLATFQDMLDVYQATEAGIRSVGGSLAIKVPKFFLEMQVSRIQTAQGNPPTAAGLQVDHLRDKVLKNAPKESQTLLDQVTALATQLS